MSKLNYQNFITLINLQLKYTKMLNIDFKVCGNLVSVPLCLTDTMDSLLTRIQNIKPFQKYSREELQVKLKLSVQKIIESGNLQDYVVDKIKNILETNSRHNIKTSIINQKRKILDETPLNILQETTLNISNYNFLQQKKLKQSKYNPISYEIGNQNDLQSKLRVKYSKCKNQTFQNKYTQTSSKKYLQASSIKYPQSNNIKHRQYKFNQNQMVNQKLRAITNDYEKKRANNLGHQYIQNEEASCKQKIYNTKQNNSVSCGYIGKSNYGMNNYSQIKVENSKYRQHYDHQTSNYNIMHKSTQKLKPLIYELSKYNNHKSVGKIMGTKKYSYL